MKKVNTKRKRVVLTIEQKLEVCQMVRDNVARKVIMDKFNLGRSTLSDIVKNEASLTAFKKKRLDLGISGSVKTAKSLKDGMFEKLDSSLYIWLRQQREKNAPVTGPLLLEKAAEFHSLLYGADPTSSSTEPFVPTYGYQYRFCQRYGIKNLKISGEKASADHVSAKSYADDFKNIIEGYSLDQVFNCDETGLYYKMLPGRTLTTVHNEPMGTKKAKDRVTINACSNASGSIKLPLLLIGKSKKPRCFAGINMSALPVVYKSQKNAWVNTFIFKEWFNDNFVPFVQKKLKELGQDPKALLILDNCSAHPSDGELKSKDGKVTAQFLPPNVTSLIQPMDQGVLETLNGQRLCKSWGHLHK